MNVSFVPPVRPGFFATGTDLDALQTVLSTGVKTVRLIGSDGDQYAITSNAGSRVVSGDFDALVHVLGGVEQALATAGQHDPLLAARVARIFAIDVSVAQQFSGYGTSYMDRPSTILPMYNITDVDPEAAYAFVRPEAHDEMEIVMEDAAAKKALRWPPNGSADFVAELMRHKAPSSAELAMMRDFMHSIVRTFDISLFSSESPMGTRARVHDDRVTLENGDVCVTLTPADVSYLMGGYERFMRFLQVTSDVAIRRMAAQPGAKNNERDGEALSSLLMIATALKRHAQVEAAWRRDGPALALDGDTGVTETPELVIEPVATPEPKPKAPAKRRAKKAPVAAAETAKA